MADKSKPAEWQELTGLTQGRHLIVERVRIAHNDVALEGAWELPQLARLSMDDQVFITAFVRSHGSIKETEQVFGVSYPTIKGRLTRIANSLEFVEVIPEPAGAGTAGQVRGVPAQQEVLGRLKRGEITAAEAVKQLEALK
jgi:hypothetical protein